MRKVILLLVITTIIFTAISFIPAGKEKVRWLSVSELQAVYAKDPKPILVDVYTGWCGWCKVMDKKTYAMDKVAAYINEHYYAVKLDAETKESLEWNGKKFNYNAEYKSNELAVYLLDGQMSYPTTVFLTALNARPAVLPGYLQPNEIEPPLKYFGDGIYKSKSFQEFNKNFTPTW